jgi:hypothetical protein
MKDELVGTPVLVHPGLQHDPARKQNEIGLIRIASVFCDEFLVGFADGTKGVYAADALLVLLPDEEIHRRIAETPPGLAWDDIKALTRVDLILRYGSSDQQKKAMELARQYKSVLEKCLDTLENLIALQKGQNLER